ncbi:uncharacterized protein DNG_10490 [Cephalotrichum gorgonifer]|uniref:Uncharacterized protein n=1 Tax=Cephalotrichum gorgonifer TaxID=2041049 RepID=A0AAE8N9J3_9PEZI|nr:uncharacterized protein DNG_10490 [Cephalotrichum gorgonifer]
MASLLLLNLEGEKFPAISLSKIADNLSDEVPGYSFAQDLQNRQDDPDTWIQGYNYFL